jgi:hypothetical protein
VNGNPSTDVGKRNDKFSLLLSLDTVVGVEELKDRMLECLECREEILDDVNDNLGVVKGLLWYNKVVT